MLGGRLVIAVMFCLLRSLFLRLAKGNKQTNKGTTTQDFKNLARSPVFRSERECLLHAKL